jgi:hypothetical protein
MSPFSNAKGPLVRSIDQLNFNLRHIGESEHRIVAPLLGVDALRAELDLLQ